MALVTWERYSSLYSGIKDEDQFEIAEQKAELEVARVIGAIHWAELPKDISGEFYAGQLCDCICKVIDYQVQAGSKAGKGITSASNDGYSESYAIVKQSEAVAELDANIRAWLSGTGLVRAY